MLASKLGIEDVADQLKDKRVLMRVDFNVPLKDGVVADVLRIDSAIPTIQYAISRGAKAVILISHCGRPDGRVQPQYSLKHVFPALQERLLKSGIKNRVTFVEDCVGPAAEAAASGAKDGEILLMENLRFHVEEEGKGLDASGKQIKADPAKVEEFRAGLTKLADVFINDAFGTAHRAHASMVGVKLPIRAAGLLMKKELDYFSKALENPVRPFLAIVGGAKVKDKIPLIKNLLSKVNMMIIGGGMAFTFKKALESMKIGNSIFDEEGAKVVADIVAEARAKNVELILPQDWVTANEFAPTAKTSTATDKEGIPDGWMGVDAGEATVKKAREVIGKAKTIVWNGPPGVFEIPIFAKGSTAFAEAVVEATKQGATSIVGGGDTAHLVGKLGYSSNISHVSTGGGASLELLEGKQLPGILALSDK